MDGLIFYDSLEVLDDPDKTLNIFKDSDQYWTTCSGCRRKTRVTMELPTKDRPYE
jgi:hypothetical protein